MTFCTAICLTALSLGTCQVPNSASKTQRLLETISFSYFPQRSVELMKVVTPGQGVRLKLGGFSTTMTSACGRARTATANGKFVYSSAGGAATIAHYRVGNGGVLQPFNPPRLSALSHPTSVSFHPNGNTLYVTCSNGAICQYR